MNLERGENRSELIIVALKQAGLKLKFGVTRRVHCYNDH